MTKLVSGPQIVHEIEALNGYLIAAQDIVKLGHMPELKGLDDRIRVLCEAIQKAEPDVQQENLPRIQALLEQLNACDQTMRESVEGKKP